MAALRYQALIDGRALSGWSRWRWAASALRRKRGRAEIRDSETGRRWTRVGGRWLEDVTGQPARPAEPAAEPEAAAGAALLHAHFTAPQDDDEDGDD